jgi:hypothetical protein
MILLMGVIAWYAMNISIPSPITSLTATTSSAATALVSSSETSKVAQNDLACYTSPRYFVITKSNDGELATRFLVKLKTNEQQNFPCEYALGNADFEVAEEGPYYFLGLTDHFLLLDFGTAPPPRGLIVYDLDSRKKIFNDQYSQPVEIHGNTVTYWTPSDRTITDENCPQHAEYALDGLGANIEAHVSLMLSTAQKKELKEYRCSPTQ